MGRPTVGMTPDPFGRAIRDFHGDRQTAPLYDRDGEAVRAHPIEDFYFGERAPDGEHTQWFEANFEGPLLDLGAGAGRDALYFQDRMATVALEVSEHLVAVLRDRGVREVRHGDMFALREHFPRDRFRSVLAKGSQLGLAGSLPGIRAFLGDLATVTTPDATAVLDNYDPRHPDTSDLIGYHPDATPGMAYRTFHFEYEGAVSETLLFRLCTPERLREATIGTGWTVAEIRGGHPERSMYRARCEKS